MPIPVNAYQKALTLTHHDDAAAKLLIDRLAEPGHRIDALMLVQQFASEPATERMREERAQWDRILQRSDVQEAIARVGTAGKYALSPWFR
ncbi:MAG: hypothetical protein JO042_15855 [Sinobacteraceae bacterium]|nr:hypothetical protein [Nevskiaceae bacterium]